MSIENKIDLDKFQDEMFKNIAPMGNSQTRIKLINIIDELKIAREELSNLKGLNEEVPRVKLEGWLFEAMSVMKKVNFLELNIVRNRIELEMSAVGMTLPKRKE